MRSVIAAISARACCELDTGFHPRDNGQVMSTAICEFLLLNAIGTQSPVSFDMN